MRYRDVVLPILAAVMLMTCHRVVAATNWQDKVDTTVLSRAASGDEPQFLIYLARQANVGAAKALTTKPEKNEYVYRTLRETAHTSQAGLLAQLDRLGVKHESFWIVNVVWAKAGADIIETIARRHDVSHLYASGYGQVRPPVTVDWQAPPGVKARMPGPEPNLVEAGADGAWSLGFEGQGVVVASADTGVNWRHETLRSQYRGWDATNQTAAHDHHWFVGADPSLSVCPDEMVEPCDDDLFIAGGHGTHTTGIMVGDDGLGNQTGMAPKAEWIACRNHTAGIGSVSAYLRCMEFFLAPTDLLGENPQPALAPDVINNSWVCTEDCPAPVLRQQLENAVAAGIFYVVSAGNDGPSCSSLAFPLAIYQAAVSVGATNHRTGNIAVFSSRGPVLNDAPFGPRTGPDISAPGVGIRAATRGGVDAVTDDYAILSGTSMASPHVAGLAALIISANPDLRGQVAVIEQIIRDTAVPRYTQEGCGEDTPASRPNNAFGWGRIDALAAVQAAIRDTDSDGIADVLDNCMERGNADQHDSDGDAIGNACDADIAIPNDCLVNFADLNALSDAFFATPAQPQWNADADFDNDGSIGFADLQIMRQAFFGAPGPSAGGCH